MQLETSQKDSSRANQSEGFDRHEEGEEEEKKARASLNRRIPAQAGKLTFDRLS